MKRHSHASGLLSRSRGFTLMEMIVVLGILTLIMGSGVYYMQGIGPERELRENAVALESMAREAQARAIMTHITHRIVITHNEFILLDGDHVTRIPEEWVELPARKTHFITDNELKVSVFRWGMSQRVFPSAVKPMVWVFSPEGFVEPITVQFDKNDSFIRQTFHPLTASVTDEEMEIR